jgi:D-amino peptidase
MTQDVNAAVRGMRRAGVESIDVFDGHGMGGNIIVEDLEREVNYLGGGWMTKLREMILEDEIQSYNALLLLGQHAAQSTRDGFLSHTNTGMSALRINGQFTGEAPQIAWLAGYFDIPTLIAVGDDALVREVDALISQVQGVAVKTSTTVHKTRCMPIDEAHKLIENSAYQRMKAVNDVQPCMLSGNFNIEIFFAVEEAADMLAEVVNFNKTGDRVVTYQAADYLEAFFAYHSCRVMITAAYRTMFVNWLRGRDGGEELVNEYLGILRDNFKNTSELFPEVIY